MRVNALKSVAAKLFYMMSILVLLTLAGNSWQFARVFITFQKEQVQNSIQMQAESAGGRIEGEFERWKAQIATALPSFQSAIQSKEIESIIKRFLAANEDLVSLSIYASPSRTSTELKVLGQAFTPLTNAPRFEDKVPKKVWSAIQPLSVRFLKKQVVQMKKQNIGVDSIAKSTGLPLMILAARFDVEGEKSVIWAVLTTWQTNIIKAMPSSPDTEFALIDERGTVVSSPVLTDMVKRKIFSGEALVRAALQGRAPSGFQDEYRVDNKRRLGAFFRLPQYDLAVLVQKDAERAYMAMRRNLLSTGLWASLFILFSVMFSYFGAQGITKALRDVTYATSRIASGDFNFKLHPRTQDEVAQLSEAVNTMSRKIVELLATQIEKARFEKELETAKMVQSTFFPKKEVKTANMTAFGFYTPASECGGDLWGHFPIDDGIDFLFIADAMGHGAPAALVTAMAYSTTMTIADIVRDRTGHADSPARILDRLNRIIFEAVRGQISMTFFASILNTRTGHMTFANAGHNFPLLIPVDRVDNRLGKKSKKKGDVSPLSLKLMGTPLGMDPSSVFKEETIELRPGDKLFYFTDGLIECSSPEGKVWGRKSLVEHVSAAWDRDGKDMKDEIVQKAFKFFGGKPLADDVTVVVAELTKSWMLTSNSQATHKVNQRDTIENAPTMEVVTEKVNFVAETSKADEIDGINVLTISSNESKPQDDSDRSGSFDNDVNGAQYSPLNPSGPESVLINQQQNNLVATAAVPKSRGKYKIKLPPTG